VGYGSWSSKLWFNQDLELAEVRELDFLAGYARPLHGLDLAVGYTRLTFPNTEAASSQELTFLMERAGAVTSSLDVHWDFDAGRGVYSTFGLSGDLPTPLKPVNLAVEVHHQSSYFDATGIPCMGVTLGIEHGIGGVTVTPAVSRFMSWENATFRGASMVPASWLVSLGVAQEF
jgi:hypothetical protein